MTARALTWLHVIALAIAPVGALAQASTAPGARLPRIAFLGFDSATMQASVLPAFLARMRALGYEDGRTVVIDYRWAEGRFERLPELAIELVALKPDVIVTATAPAIRAVQQATTTVPTIAVTTDPVLEGAAKTFARPGGNVTGVAFQDAELSTKRMDLLRGLVPNLNKVAVIRAKEASVASSVAAFEEVARSMRIQVLSLEVAKPNDIADAFATAKSWGAQGILQLTSPFLATHKMLLIDAAARHKLPMMCESRFFVVSGCLATYSASLPAMFAQLADYVDRLLRGARVETMPIEQPREFEFLINQKTADSLALAIPASIRLQVTDVVR